MRATSKRVFFVFFVVLGGAACTLNPTEQQAADEFGPALCQRLQECVPKDYAAAYPKDSATDHSQCQAAGEKAVTEPDKQDACSQKQLDACTADIKVMDCMAISAALAQKQSPPLPTSCNGC